MHIGACSEESLKQLLDSIINDKDKLVIICGDLTLNSTDPQFERCKQFFQSILDAGVTIVATCGNHDFGGTMAEKMSTMIVINNLNNDYERSFNHLKQLFLPLYQQNGVIAYNENELDYIIQKKNDIFVSLRSHHRKKPRVKDEQVNWVKEHLDKIENREDYRLHLVTHYSLWQDPGDKHVPLDRRRRLEEEILIRYNFKTILHGHNHRYTYQNTTTPKFHYRILRISSPTISNRTRHFECGYLVWKPEEGEPKLVIVENNTLSLSNEILQIELDIDSSNEESNTENTQKKL